MALHVIFGTGVAGRATARALLAANQSVRMVNRSGAARGLPAGVEMVAADAYDPAQAQAAAQGATAVYQCAQPAYHEWPRYFPALQETILKAAAAHQARFIVLDNLYGYGAPPAGQALREDSPQNPHTVKGRVRAALAQTVLAAHRSGQVRAGILRASNFFSGEYDLLMNLLFKPALTGGTVNLLGRLDQPHSFTYVPDLGRALAALGQTEAGLGQVWLAPTLPALTQQALIDQLAALIGRPIKVRTAGKLLLSLLGLFNPAMRESVEMLYEWEQPFIVDSSALTARFGIAPTPLPTALAEALAVYQANQPR